MENIILNNLKTLNEYFQSGTAEGDASFLQEIFVPFEEYTDIIKIPHGGPRILLGNKGSGKSAIIRYFRAQLQELDIPVILIRPKDIQFNEKSDSSLGVLTRACEAAILKAIASKIGTNLKHLVLNLDDKKLLQVAKETGAKDSDVIENMLKLLSPIGKSISGVDFSQIKIGLSDIGNVAIKRSIESNLSRSKKSFYVFIDDTDQIAAPNESGHLNRIWAFFLASRSIMEECTNIKFIITLRDEVWRRLNRDGAGQRDQVDHFRNLAFKIDLSEKNLKDIIKRRLEVVKSVLKINQTGSPYKLFFDTNKVKIPTSVEEFRVWDDFIIKRSRGRPRDSIQLIFKLSQIALKNEKNIIDASDVEKVMPLYSEERVDDLKRECDEECPQIKDIIRAFHSLDYDAGSFTLKPDTAAHFINSLPTRFSIKLFGIPIKPDDKDSVFSLWRFLHEVGFMNARISDTRERLGFRHISAEDDPDLISPSRWNEMQAITWEIHPAYRDYLIKLKNENQFSFGLPQKKRKNKR